MSMVSLLLLWSIGDAVAHLMEHRRFKEVITGPLFLITGMALSIVTPEVVVRVARIAGVPADSWLGGLHETIFNFPSFRTAGSSFDLQALLAYLHVFSDNEGKIMAFAVAIATGVLAWQAWETRSGSVLRGLSIFVFTAGFSELSTIFKGVQMAKFVTGLLPGVPLVLGYLLARVVRTISAIQPNKWHVGRSAMVRAVVVCGLVAGWGYWHAKARIEWATGHNDAYVLVQGLRPERIFYSGGIWDFHFGGMVNAFSIVLDGFPIQESASGRDILVVEGTCGDNQTSTDEIAVFLSRRPHLFAEVKAFDYTANHDIDPTLAELGKNICHAVYSF
tara:strand:- start:31 stop:1029 length:999 start_codon:yes stop_codon:yes gene_type:complete